MEIFFFFFLRVMFFFIDSDYSSIFYRNFVYKNVLCLKKLIDLARRKG